jgi:hypothetical protein
MGSIAARSAATRTKAGPATLEISRDLFALLAIFALLERDEFGLNR